MPSDVGDNPPGNIWTDQTRHLLDSAMDAVITIDLSGRVLEWNHQAEVMFDYPRDHAVGRPMDELIIPESQRERYREGVARFRDTGQRTILGNRVELTARRKDGGEFPVELSAIDVAIDGQTVFHAFIRDITTWKESEKRIARDALEAKLLQQAATFSVGGMIFDDALRNCIRTVCEVTGWPLGHAFIPNAAAKRMISSRIWHADEPEQFREFRSATEKSLFARGEGLPGLIWETLRPLWIRDVNVDPDFSRKNAVRDLSVRGAFGFPIVSDDKVVAILEFFHHEAIEEDPSLLILVHSIGRELGNFIERRRAVEEHSRLAAIVESSRDAIIAKSLDGTIISWNNGAELVYGYSAEQMIGRSIKDIIPESHEDEEPEIRDVLTLGKRLEQFETQRRRSDGTLIDVAITVSPIRNSDGAIVGTSTIERDISLRKQRERELNEAKEAAEAANKTKGEFLTNISHELRTPMNAIIGMLELVLGEDLSPVMADYLQTAHDSAHTLLHLLNDLLDFSRMEAGRFELAPIPFELRNMLDRTMKMLSLRANEKGLELACHVHSDVPEHVRGDEKRLQQVLINLVGNGIKFTQQGEVIVDIHLRSRVDDTAILEFHVIDTGIGISKADQEKIFAPFAQADATTTRQYTGTGLGLAICHELVDRMGGNLWVDSEPGKGSRFSFTVCLDLLDEPPEDQKQIQAVAELRDMPVLVVDDNETNRRILEEMLTNWRMQPIIVDNGNDALAELRNRSRNDDQRVPLILVDALMPNVDGFTFIETAREQGILEGSTVLMLSSADRQVFQERCDELDIAAYLEKPVSQSDLFDALMTALRGPELDRQSVSGIQQSDRALRVLLVEDTPANQKVVNAILNKRGHQVSIAGNGRDAVDLMQREQFDVVLMDVQMPTMDGFQATEAIRRFEDERAEIPIIAMTAHAMRGDRERCLEAGMDDYISKPIDAKQLIELIDRHTAGHTIEETPAPPSPTTEANSRINRHGALQRLGGDVDLLADMIGFFIEDVPALLETARNTLESEDLPELRRAAHSIKGLAANLGAATAIDSARAVEDAAKVNDLRRARDLMPRMELEIGLLLLEAERYGRRGD